MSGQPTYLIISGVQVMYSRVSGQCFCTIHSVSCTVIVLTLTFTKEVPVDSEPYIVCRYEVDTFIYF